MSKGFATPKGARCTAGKTFSLRCRLLVSLALSILSIVILALAGAFAVQKTLRLSQQNIHVGQTEVLPSLKLEARVNGADGVSVLAGESGSISTYATYTHDIERRFKRLEATSGGSSRPGLARAHSTWLQATEAIMSWTKLPPLQRKAATMRTENYFINRTVLTRHLLARVANRQAAMNVARLGRQQQVRDRYFLVLGVTCVAGVVAALLAAWRLAKAFLEPLGEIGQGLERLGEGDLGYRLARQGADELGAVAVAVNAMASQLQQQQTELLYSARHDALTGLPNRVLLSGQLEARLQDAQRGKELMAVIVLDLDRFKEVNDTLGHHIGDLLLKEIGPRLRFVLREGDFVARMGGDEFAILISPTNTSISEASKLFSVLGRRLNDALVEPFLIDGLSLALDASIGIAIYPRDGETAELLLQRADVAMYVSKRSQSSPVFYDTALDGHDPRKLTLMAQLRDAIVSGELVVYYQPIIELSTNAVVGAEALVRWQHPQEGLLGPAEFVHLAENSGDIRQLTAYVVSSALEQSRKWAVGGHDLVVSVNVSAKCLLDLKLPEMVAAALTYSGVEGPRLKLEITESAIIEDPVSAIAILKRLAKLNVQTSIDDFGTGYSSIAYLRDVAIQELKVDKSFVARLLRDTRDEAIVRSSIELAHRLKMTVVAEGVEEPEIHEELCRLGSDRAQGYLYSRPLPADEFMKWLQSWERQQSKIPECKAGPTSMIKGLIA